MQPKSKSDIEQIYQDEAIFWCHGARDLPISAQLQDALAARFSGVLLFEGHLSGDEKLGCVETVQHALPNARVEGIAPIGQFDRILLKRVLARDEIISHTDELLRAAREFARLADGLSRQLADKIGVSATELSLCGQYLPEEKDFEQTSILNADWKYFFHGFECGFSHQSSGQHLDVIFGFRDEFGVIDAWFWAGFIETTPHYRALSSWLALGADDVQTAINVLLEAGLFIEIEGSPDFVFEVHGRRGCIVAAR